MNQKKFFALTLLGVVALLAITSCKDDENWQPTWAVPLVKEMNLQLGEFIDSSQVREFNTNIKNIWHNYVEEQAGISGDSTVIDSVAFAILTKNGGESSYVDYGEDGVPKLNQATRDSLRRDNSSVTEDQLHEIDNFLADYWSKHPELHPSQRQAKSSSLKQAGFTVRPKASGGGSSGGAFAIDYLLNGVIGNSNDVFVVSANLIDHMGNSYLDSVNNQLDSVLEKANMDDLIDLDLSSMTKGNTVSHIKLDMSLSNSLPFNIEFLASFVNANGDSILNVFNGNLSAYAPEQSLEPFDEDGSTLNQILDETKGVRLKILCKKNTPLESSTLRALAKEGITFSMRVSVKAKMSDLF